MSDHSGIGSLFFDLDDLDDTNWPFTDVNDFDAAVTSSADLPSQSTTASASVGEDVAPGFRRSANPSPAIFNNTWTQPRGQWGSRPPISGSEMAMTHQQSAALGFSLGSGQPGFNVESMPGWETAISSQISHAESAFPDFPHLNSSNYIHFNDSAGVTRSYTHASRLQLSPEAINSQILHGHHEQLSRVPSTASSQGSSLNAESAFMYTSPTLIGVFGRSISDYNQEQDIILPEPHASSAPPTSPIEPLSVSEPSIDNPNPASTSVRSSRRSTFQMYNPNFQHPCQVCGRRFTTRGHARRHLQRCHTAVASRPHACDLCTWRFNFPREVDRHRQSAHRDAAAATAPIYLCRVPSCYYNGRGFPRRDNRDRHERQQHGIDSRTSSLDHTNE